MFSRQLKRKRDESASGQAMAFMMAIIAIFSFLAGLLLVRDIKLDEVQLRRVAGVQSASGSADINRNTDNTYYVDTAHSSANDGGACTSSSAPCKTILAAYNKAAEANKSGKSSTVLVSPGTYREEVRLFPRSGTQNKPIILKSTQVGGAIISGFDKYSSWQQHSGSVYRHSWSFDWGIVPVPSGWGNNIPPNIVRRKEVVMVNGQNMEQVLSYGELGPGKFFVNEGEDRIYLQPPSGVAIGSANVEVAVRGKVLEADNVDNLVLIGFKVQGAAEGIQDGGGNSFIRMDNLTLEDMEFSWNGKTGFGLVESANITVRRSKSNNNGGSGMNTYIANNVLVEDSEVSNNNWRGARGQWYGWDLGGVKNLHSHNQTFRRFKANNNQTRGFWTDTDMYNILLEDVEIINNRTDAMFIEATHGPVELKRVIIAGNQGGGILSANTRAITLDQTILYNNKDYQIRYSGLGSRPTFELVKQGGSYVATNYVYLPKADEWTIKNSILMTGDSSQVIINTRETRVPGTTGNSWDQFATTYLGSNNTWYSQDPNKFMYSGDGYKIFSNPNATQDSQKGWVQLVFNRETNSTFSNPTSGSGDVLTQLKALIGVGGTGSTSSSSSSNSTTTSSSSSAPGGTFNVPAPEVSGTTVKVQAENYKVGGEGTGYHDLPLDGITQEGNAGGAYRTGDSVDIKEISGGHAVGWMKTGEWLKYDLPISQAGRYRMIIRGAALEAGRDLRIEVNGQWVGEVQAPPTGDYANLTETYLTGIDLPQGNIEVRIEVLQEYMDLDYFMFVKDDREKACRGDYNRDGIVNLSDFQTFAVNYKQPNIQCSLNIDLDGCTLDLADFQSFALVYKDESACSN